MLLFAKFGNWEIVLCLITFVSWTKLLVLIRQLLMIRCIGHWTCCLTNEIFMYCLYVIYFLNVLANTMISFASNQGCFKRKITCNKICSKFFFHKLSVMIVYCIKVLLITSFNFTENAIYVSGTNFEIQMIFYIILNLSN